VTIVNNAGLKPVVIKGGVVKSINQFYNKAHAKYKSIKDKQDLASETKRLQNLTRKRNNKIHDLFHKISRIVIGYCITHDIGTIAIGYNKAWKQGARLGKRNTQQFVQVPFLKLVKQICYKGRLLGVNIVLVREDYTSKCSFIDGESVEKHEKYLGQRFSRGLFRTMTGVLINADVNAGYNIIKKAVPNATFADGIEGEGLNPYSIAV